MRKFKVRKQIRNLYFITAIGSFQIAGASWVALLALRGFSIVQIGILESIFHVVSMCFEIPSGVVADVFGRRKTMIISQYLTLISGTFMILSNSFWTEVPANEKRCEDPILVQLQNCVKDSFAFLRENRKTRGIIVAVLTLFTGNPYVICAGGFLAAFSDDFLEVRTDILLNSMIPSEQRATLVSVCSFAFSVVMIVLSPIMGWFFS